MAIQLAIQYICDRCGVSYNNGDLIKRVNIPNPDFSFTWEIGADLCSSCIRNIHENMKPLSKQKKE